jgi:transposase InsO family protein
METQTEYKIKVLRSDNAAEYVSARQSNRLTELGIIHEKSAPYTPQQNGVAERENRTVVEMARSMLYASKS